MAAGAAAATGGASWWAPALASLAGGLGQGMGGGAPSPSSAVSGLGNIAVNVGVAPADFWKLQPPKVSPLYPTGVGTYPAGGGPEGLASMLSAPFVGYGAQQQAQGGGFPVLPLALVGLVLAVGLKRKGR